MARKGFEALREQLGGDAPAALKELEPRELEELAGAIREARRREREALIVAGDRALNKIPRVLRGPIKRVVG
jgi:hypothetical protein